MADRGRVVRAGSRVRLGLASDEWLVACVRRGDTAAFEALYDRHARELLGFCVYMLGSRQDAEDAVQATLASAYRALRADSRPIALRPWLFAIARNDCLSILRKRRPVLELNGELAHGADPVEQIEVREEVRRLFEGLRDLPERQRAALLLSEVNGLSHSEVAEVLGVRAEQVKAFVYQARSKLVSERAARDADCREIREELAGARGAALLRGRLRRHVRSCPDCRVYADRVAHQRRQLGALLPVVVPPLALKYRAVEEALRIGASDPASVAAGATVGATAAGTAAEIAGGGFKALACKLAAGMVCFGASAGVGVSVLGRTEASGPQNAAGTIAAAAPLVASVKQPGSLPWAASGPVGGASGGPVGVRDSGGGKRRGGAGGGLPVVRNGFSGGTGARPENSGGSISGPERQAREGAALPGGGEKPGGGGESSSQGEHRATAEHRQTKQAGRQQLGEEHAKARQERKSSQPPPRSEEELKRKHEEVAHRREEHKPEGHSRAPKTEEELRLKRERSEQRKAERREAEKKQQELEAEEARRREQEGSTPGS